MSTLNDRFFADLTQEPAAGGYGISPWILYRGRVDARACLRDALTSSRAETSEFLARFPRRWRISK